jgi:TolA-binding protein
MMRSEAQAENRCGVLLMLAVSVLSVAIAAAAEDAKADQLFETAMGAYKLERYEDAATKFYDFMAAAPYDPRNDQAQYYIGRCYMHRNFLNKAIEEFGYLIEDFPDSQYTSLGLYDLAQCYLKVREDEKARQTMEKVIARPVKIYHGDQDAMLRQLYENHRAAVFYLAKYYLDNKKYDEAIAAYRKLPYEMEAFRYVVDVYYSIGEFEKIKELIDGLEDKNRHEAFKYLVEFYAKNKAINQLKGVFLKLLQEKEPTNLTDDLVWTTAWNFQHIDREHWNWAMKNISDHYPRLARRADYELARYNWQDIKYQDDLELFVIKYRTGNDVDEVLRWKGITLERAGRADDARADYKRIGNTAQGHWYICESYHGAYARNKDLDAAIAEYVKFRTAFYSMEWAAMAQWRVAELYRAKNDVDRAVEALRHLVNRFGSVVIEDGNWVNVIRHNLGRNKIHFGADGQLALGDVLREAKRWDDAILEYKVVVTKYPKLEQASWAAYRTALCYEGKDDTETAIAVLKSCLRRYGKTAAGSDAHTRLESKYKVADTEVSDDIDVFEDENKRDKKSYLEDPSKMKRR